MRSKLTITGEGDTNSDPNLRNNPGDRRVDVILDYRDESFR